jgi:hypothetical protein
MRKLYRGRRCYYVRCLLNITPFIIKNAQFIFSKLLKDKHTMYNR